MARSDDKLFVNSLFIAVPELLWEDIFVEYLRANGFISARGVEIIERLRADKKRFDKLRRKVRGKSLFGRILAIAPDLLTVNTVTILNKIGVVKDNDLPDLKVLVGILNRGRGPLPKDLEGVVRRAKRIFGEGFVRDWITFLYETGQITQDQSNRLLARIPLATLTTETAANIIRAKTIQQALQLIGSGLGDAASIDALRRAGLLTSSMAESLLTSLSYGSEVWNVWEGSRRANGLAARMSYLLTGAFNWNLVRFLKSTGRLSDTNIKRLEIAIRLSQLYHRELQEEFTERRFRVKPGESPIVSYLRASKETEDALSRLLAESARDASRQAEHLAALDTVSSRARGAEYANRAKGLQDSLLRLWDGIGYINIFGQKKVSDAAITASELLQKRYYRNLPDYTHRMLEFQARSGIDSFISRRENTFELSRRVYGNYNLWTGKVQKQIDIGLLQGQSASEIADRVKSLINPSVPGGVKYAALRLGRTELANAFHQTTIRHTREMPWVQGYKWNRSGSHRGTDICDQYANDDHDGLGPGIFKKANVPDKPHPQCLCYLTVVGMDEAAFIKGFKAGRFNSYMSQRIQESPIESGVQQKFAKSLVHGAAKAAGTAAGTYAVATGVDIGAKMLAGGATTLAFNPFSLRGAAKADQIASITAARDKGSRRIWAEAVEVQAAGGEGADQVANWIEDNIEDEAQKLAIRKQAFDFKKDQLARRIQAAHRTDADPYETIFAEHRAEYRNIFDGEGFKPDGTPLPINLGDALGPEAAAKRIYGTTSYRPVNGKLRYVNGDLNKYDDLHGNPAFWNETNDIARNLEEGGDYYELADQVADVFNNAHLEDVAISAVKAAQKKGLFGFKEDDIGGYYEEIGEAFSEMFNGDEEEVWSTGFSKFTKHSDVVKSIDRGMMPTKDDRMLYRVAGHDWLGLDHVPDANDIGHIFQDDAFISTEGVPMYFFNKGPNSLSQSTRPVRYAIHAPAGTYATRFNPHENEVGLARGTRFQVLDVVDVLDDSGYAKEVHLSVVNQMDTWTEAIREYEAQDEDQMWDQIFGDF